MLDGANWWSQYGTNLLSDQALPLISFLGAAGWCFLLALWLGVVAFKIRGEGSGVFNVRAMILAGAVSNVLLVASLIVSEYALHRHGDADLVIWLVSSTGVLPFFQSGSVARMGIVLFYNLLSNCLLHVLIARAVFGVVV